MTNVCFTYTNLCINLLYTVHVYVYICTSNGPFWNQICFILTILIGLLTFQRANLNNWEI